MSEESRLGREAIETVRVETVDRGRRACLGSISRTVSVGSDSATDKILLSLTAFADELEREKARQRTYEVMQRKAKAGHVTDGGCFGYRNVAVTAPTGTRSHVERRIREPEAAIVRRCSGSVPRATV
jgi:DNA invertase Pin-like site-specific DNA recombinase